MNVFLVSDDDATTDRVRKILFREGLECPASHILSIDLAVPRLTRLETDLVVVVLPKEPESAVQALDMLSSVPRHGGLRVLAVGPASDPKVVIRALRGLVDDYVDEADLDGEFPPALTRWRKSLSLVNHHEDLGRVIGVLAPSGGSGSSTLAANVATVLAKEHTTAALIDMKLEAGDLAALLDLKPSYSLADLCQNLERMDRSMFERMFARHDSGVHLLAPPRSLADVRRVTPDGVQQALKLARTIFPYVVVDLDHSFREEQIQVLRQTNVILLVLRLDFASLRNTRRTLDYLEHLDIARDRVQLVANRYGQPKEVPYAKAEEALGVKITHFIPDDPKTINRANNNGVPVVLEAPSTKVARSVSRMAISVNGRHKG
jgi:pilus assembly protein CpaE